MAEEKVLNEAEIKNIKSVREDFQILVGQVGEVEIGIINLNKRKKELEIELGKNPTKRKRYSCRIRKKIW